MRTPLTTAAAITDNQVTTPMPIEDGLPIGPDIDTGVSQLTAYARDLRLALADRDHAASEALAARRMCLQLTQGMPELIRQQALSLRAVTDDLSHIQGEPSARACVAMHAIRGAADRLVDAADNLGDPQKLAGQLALVSEDSPIDALDIPTMDQTWLRLERTIRDLTHERESSVCALHAAQTDGLQRLIQAAELKDDDTGTHIRRMGYFSALIGRACGLPANQCDTLLLASRMHDVGKIGIPDNILQKRGPLDESDWIVMRKHPEIGAALLRGGNTPLYDMAAEVALGHHEKFDGSGYPGALVGTQIPLTARIVTLADFFDAVTMDRCYRPAMTDEKAFSLVREGSGKHFDPAVVDAFFRTLPELVAARRQVNAGETVTY